MARSFRDEGEKDESEWGGGGASGPDPEQDPDFQKWKKDQQAGTGGGPSVGINPQTGQMETTVPENWTADSQNWAGNQIFDQETDAMMHLLNGGLMGPTKGPEVVKIKDVMWRFYQWDIEKVRQLAKRLEAAGFEGITENSPRGRVWNAFSVLVRDAALAYASDPKSAPTLDLVLKELEQGATSAAGTGQQMPKDYTQTSTALTDPGSAKLLLTRTLTEQLGRAPTKAEHAAFLAALNTEERKNPRTVFNDYDEKTGQLISVTSSGGMEEAGRVSFADDFVMGDEELAQDKKHYQMATSLMGALEGALGATVGP